MAGMASDPRADAATAVLPAVWARKQIQSLSDYAEVEGRAASPDEVRKTARSGSA